MSQDAAVPADAADSSSTSSLGDEIAGMLGEYVPSGRESPEPDQVSAEGTTPSEPLAGTEKADDATPGAEAPTALSDGTTPDPLAADESDPFADTTPATFTVNGVAVTNEDIRVFKEGGAVIRPEALQNVLSKLSERESLQERNHRQSTEYQTLSKVLEWQDPSSGTKYTGPEAAIEMRIGNASLLAENNLLLEYLTDPDKLYSILTTEQIPDGKGGVTERVILNPTALSALQRENSLTQRELTATIRDHYKSVIAEASKPTPLPVDFEQATPALVKQIAEASKLDASVLTPADQKLLADLLPDHTKDGQVGVKWQNLAKSMMTDRASQKANTQSVVSATEKATREGAARMAAAARGVKPNKPVVPAKPATEPNERVKADSDLWDVMERAGSRAMRQHT